MGAEVPTAEGREAVAPAEALGEWVSTVLAELGASRAHADSVSRVLLYASLRGVDSHGVARLPAYVRLIDADLIALDAEPEAVRSDGATAVVDARNCFGQPAGELGVELACNAAERYGLGFCVVRRSNHFGVVGYYTGLAADRGLIAIGGTNSHCVVAPSRARERFIGTNPISVAAPADPGPDFNFDASASAVAGGKLEVAMRAGQEVPTGWGITPEGEHTTDPSAIIPAGGALLPLGGTEESGSHKGYALALIVELLSSVLCAGPHGAAVGPLTSGTPRAAADVSHFFLAVDPARFEVGDQRGFAARLGELASELRALDPVDPELPVLVPGDPETETARRRAAAGIPLDPVVHEALAALGERLDNPLPLMEAHQ